MQLKIRLWDCFCAILVVFMAAAPARADDEAAPNVAAQFHCAGSAMLRDKTKFLALQKALNLPSAGPVKKLAVERLALLLAGALGVKANPAAGPLLEPLVSDVLNAEAYGSFGGTPGQPLDFLLAVEMPRGRAGLWKGHLDKVFRTSGEPFASEGFNGWRWARGAKGFVWIVSAGDWLVAGRGEDGASTGNGYLRGIARSGRPGPPLQDSWLEAQADWSALSPWLPEWAGYVKPARVNIKIAGEQDNLRLTAQVVYPAAMDWQAEAPAVPADLVRNPLISFTTGGDVAAFLNLSPNFLQLDGDPLTNRFYAWAMSQMMFQTYMAWPTTNGTNAMAAISREAPAEFSAKLKKFNGTELRWQERQQRLVLSNLRVMFPSLQLLEAKAGQFLFLAFFPPSPASQPPPDQLLGQVNNRKDLVYYDWELTGRRMHDWLFLGPMLLTRFHDSTDEEDAARLTEDKWLEDLSAFAGNTVTEITRVGPNELAVVRDGPVGLTGIEMFLLANWLSQAGLPSMQSSPPSH
jgi:hypothetical protein